MRCEYSTCIVSWKLHTPCNFLTIWYASFKKSSMFRRVSAGSAVGRASWALSKSFNMGVRSVITNSQHLSSSLSIGVCVCMLYISVCRDCGTCGQNVTRLGTATSANLWRATSFFVCPRLQVNDSTTIHSYCTSLTPASNFAIQLIHLRTKIVLHVLSIR